MGDLEETQYFDEYALPDSTPPFFQEKFSDYEGNESVAEGGDKLNNDSSPTVYVEIK